MFDLSPIVQVFFSSQIFLALLFSLAVIPLLKLPAKRLGLVDHPGGRKQHTVVASLVGGPAIIISLSLSMVVWGLPTGYEGMTYAVLGLFIIGLIDDQCDISAKLRLVVQTSLIVSALWIDNIWLTDILITETIKLNLGVFNYPLTIIVILGIMNAINMLDGLDGLSSGIVLIILGFIISISVVSGVEHISSVGVVLFGSVLGFWAYNYRFSWRKKATVFMGDSGTTILGFMLPYLAIKLSLASPLLVPKSFLLWLFAIPLWDICAVIIKRLKDGKSPLIAGRDHIHHVFMNSGFTVRQTLHMIYLLCIATTAFGVCAMYFGFAVIETYIIFLAFMTIYLGRVGSLTRKPKESAEVYDLELNGCRRGSNLDGDTSVVSISRSKNK